MKPHVLDVGKRREDTGRVDDEGRPVHEKLEEVSPSDLAQKGKSGDYSCSVL